MNILCEQRSRRWFTPRRLFPYTYRPDGLRASKTTNGVTTSHIWDGDNITMDITGFNIVRYIRGINLISAVGITVNFTGKFYYLYNAHGDVTMLTDTSGAVAKTYDYDAFGVEKNPVATDANPFRYCGEYFDKETDTYYLRARYYNPKTGRFTSQDPASDGLNWYTYANNNPILFIDPWGLASYIFYEKDFYEQATSARKYGSFGDDVKLIFVDSYESFKLGWNSMDDSKGRIDNVLIFLHSGSPQTLYVGEKNKQLISYDGTETPSGLGAIYIGDRRELQKKSIDTLDLSVCNSGHLDYTNNGGNGINDNMAIAFMNTHDVNNVNAWDGSTAYVKIGDFYGARLSKDQDSFYRVTPEKNFLFTKLKRLPSGIISYYQGKDGKIKWTIPRG